MKKLATFALIGALAVFATTMISCKKGGENKKGSAMTVKFNDKTYSIPTTLTAEEGHYYDDSDLYELRLRWEAPDGNFIDVYIELAKSMTGATPYTLAAGETGWHFETSLHNAAWEEIATLYAENDEFATSKPFSIVSGRIRLEHMGGGKFRLAANAVNKGGDTFSIDFEGTLTKNFAA